MAAPQQQRDKAILPVALALAVLVVVSLALSAWTGGSCW
jgi:hypothetical protein